MNDERNWKTKFDGFPDIPKSKQWGQKSPNTLEQEISQKLLLEQPISQEEVRILKEAIAYYKAVIVKLRSFSINGLSSEDLERFKELSEESRIYH